MDVCKLAKMQRSRFEHTLEDKNRNQHPSLSPHAPATTSGPMPTSDFSIDYSFPGLRGAMLRPSVFCLDRDEQEGAFLAYVVPLIFTQVYGSSPHANGQIS